MNTLKGSRRKWAEVFENPKLSLDMLKAQALIPNSNLGTEGIRSVCWKVYLSLLPTLELSTWPFAMTKEREKYIELRKKYIKAIGSDDGPEPDLEVNNPLSLAEDSPWQQFFVDSELRKIIRQDVERTLPDIDYFRSEKVQDQLNDILFIYCKINQDVSYRQGMHELVAHILWVVSSESLDVSAESESASEYRDPTLEAMRSVLDSTYIEHDAYALFSSLMSRAKPWYEFSDEGGASRRNRPNTTSHTQLFGKPESPEPAGKQTPVIEWSMKIFHYLERIDNELYLHLKSLEIQPQLFGIRWFRLLFGREFPMEDALTLWDGIFSQDPSLNICIFIGLALLLKIRDDLLQEDFSGCLHKLMRYPAVKDVKIFIPQALKLQKMPNAIGGQEVIRQNYVLEGKALPSLPSDGDQGIHDNQQFSKRNGSPSTRQVSNYYDQSKIQTQALSGSSFVQHLPPAALDAIKPVAEGFVHATKNVLESKGGAALNKAIHDMKKNTQSYMRKANTPTPESSSSNFPPMFDQVITSSNRATTSNQSANISKSHTAIPNSNTSGGGTNHVLDKQSRSQLGQIVAKALVVLEAEFTALEHGNNDKVTSDVAKSVSKAKTAAFNGLEHVRDVLLGLTQEINPLVIESGMLENSTTPAINEKKPISSTPKSSLDQKSSTLSSTRRPANSVLPSAKVGIPNSISSPIRSSFEISKEVRSPSRSSSYTSGAISIGSVEQETPEVKVYAPVPVQPVAPPKPFSFDDLIEDSVPSAKGSSSSPGSGGSSGVISKVKSPRSSLAHSQFSWMLSDEGVASVTSTGSPLVGQPIGAGVSNSGTNQSIFSSTSPSTNQRIKIDPLAGSVSRRSGTGTSVANSGLIPISNQQSQDDDPLSL